MSNHVRKFVVKALAVVLCAGAVTACKTTEEYMKEYDVDLAETHIVLPQALLDNKDFKIKQVQIKELASYKAEIVHFSGGLYAYERFFRGGFKAASKKSLLDIAAENYEGFTPLTEPNAVSGQMGDVFYVTMFHEQENVTCVLGYGNYGATVNFRSGSGYEARTFGRYCEKGRKADLAQSVLQWLKKIKLRS